MGEDISLLIFVALVNTGLVLIAYKWKIIDIYEQFGHWFVYKYKWKLPKCNFCLFFWMGFFEYICFETFSFETLFLYPLCSAVISRKLFNV